MNRDTKLIEKLVESALDHIGEHAESVRIFVTYPNDNSETTAYTSGRGNFYAQLGQIAEWQTRMNELAKRQERDNPSSEGEAQ